MAGAAEAGAAPRPVETAPAELATELGRNPAFDGVRFVAVAAVLASHFAIPGGRAGFLGVDIFFVLSGFLITAILLGQLGRGHVRLDKFWARRVRRLAPALVLLLLAILVWGSELSPSTVRDTLRGDITATLLYVANWHFIGPSHYFGSASEQPSTLLHMWSLAVEEQFYVLWPIVIFLVALLVRGRVRLPLVGGIAVAGIAFSAWRLYSLWNFLDPTRVDRAYMGTDSRMFEPLLGAALAVLLVWRPRFGSGRIANVALIAFGVGTLTAGFSTLAVAGGPNPRYAEGGALIFSLGAAALIWAVAQRASFASSVLGLPPVAYLGRISYGIYLWHWPLICWVNSHQLGLGRLATLPLGVRVYILVVLTVGLAALSYHLVEKPIRYGRVGMRLRGMRIALVLPATLGILLVLNVTQVVAHAGAAIQLPGVGPTGAPTKVTKTIVLVGDSVPGFFAPELADAAAKYGYTVVSATSAGCPATAVKKVYSNGWPFPQNRCPLVAGRQDATVRQYDPALVLWWSRYEVTSRLGMNGRLLRLGSPAYQRAQHAAFDSRVAALTRLGARVVAVQIEHPGVELALHDPPERYILFGPTLLHNWTIVRKWNEFLASHHGPRVYSIEINSVVCHKPLWDNTCGDRLPDGQSARPIDGIHYVTAAGPVLAPVIIVRALRTAGLPPYRARTNR